MADPNREIPDESRTLVETRQGHRCLRCMGMGRDWHHRRSRRVRAGHRHCACNGALLCRTCHSWAHANPDEAQAVGLLVSQWVDEPGMVPVIGADGRWWELTCGDVMLPLTENDIVTDGVGGFVVSRTGTQDGQDEAHKVE